MSVQSAEVDKNNVNSSNIIENDQGSVSQNENTNATTNGDKSDEFKLFVSNIPQDYTNKQLEELLSPVGKILKVKIIPSRFKKPNNFGFVSFENAENVSKAIEQYNGKDLEGRPLKVEAAVERTRTNRPKSKPRRKKVDPAAASTENTENQDKTPQEPTPAGEKPKNTRSRRHRKKPATNDAANTAGESQDKNTTGEKNDSSVESPTNGNTEEVNGSQSKDRSSKPRGPRRKSFNSRQKSTAPREPSTTTLYVSNLPGSLTDEGLLQVFGTFGAVKAYIIRSPYNKRSKRFGFVEFSSPEDQNRALTDIGEVEINGRVLSVSIALNRPSVEETTSNPPVTTEA